jgi:citrate synthase
MLIKSMWWYGHLVEGMLDSEQAARRLGVKLATLYAYVSRGVIESHRSGDNRRRLFVAEDVEALARRTREAKSTQPKFATVLTGITEIRDDGPVYRGHRASDLAESATYEEVAELLWGTGGTAEVWRQLSIDVPRTLPIPDRLDRVVLSAGTRDPRRGDLRPRVVVDSGRALIATMAQALALAHGRGDRDVPALRLGRRRVPRSVAAVVAGGLIPKPRPRHVSAVNAAMVLLADHELAASTLAVRVAASTRADHYHAILAGLGAMAGPLHSGAPVVVEAFLREADRVGAGQAVDETLRRGTRLPGFGHAVYRAGDGRFPVLRRLLEGAAPPRWAGLLDSVLDAAEQRGEQRPNIDLALGAMTLGFGMPPGASRAIFTIARVGGWIAHYLEELLEPPLRFRTRAIYASRL